MNHTLKLVLTKLVILFRKGLNEAEAIKEQFQKAQEELKADQTNLPIWFPILSQLGPALLVESEHGIDLSKTLVKDWLIKYMFRNDVQAVIKASLTSNWLSNPAQFKSHGRAIKIPDLERNYVKVVNIRTDSRLYLTIDELYCCLEILFSNSPTYKIFENSKGDAMIRHQQTGLIPIPKIQPTPPSPRKKIKEHCNDCNEFIL